jgi:enoyl-CoA hydratase
VIDAQTACTIGLANRVVEPDSLLEDAETLAKTILGKGPISVRLVKTAVNRGLQADIDTGGEIESQSFGLCFASGQTKEGMSAFLEKRDPNFT